MDVLNDIYAAIAAEGFTAETLQMIDNYANEIQNGREDFFRFNLSEHAGLCKGGSPLIGASIVACYATASLRASCNAEGREGNPVVTGGRFFCYVRYEDRRQQTLYITLA